MYLPAGETPGAWLGEGFRLGDLNTVTIGDLPARLDWSIIGCTILLLALINLEKTEEKHSTVLVYKDFKRGMHSVQGGYTFRVCAHDSHKHTAESPA